MLFIFLIYISIIFNIMRNGVFVFFAAKDQMKDREWEMFYNFFYFFQIVPSIYKVLPLLRNLGSSCPPSRLLL